MTRAGNTFITGLIVAATTATAALAGIPALGFGEGIAYTSEHTFNFDTNRYEINGPTSGFYFEPDAGAWEKQLFAPPNGFIPGEIYCVSEWFTFLPDPTGAGTPLADWHETILPGNDGLVWDIWTDIFGPPIISTDPGGPPLPGLEYMISGDGTSLWFDFDPIDIGPDGLTLHIEKYFRYTGATIGFEPVTIIQHPTPAPGALALLGLAGMAAAKRRR